MAEQLVVGAGPIGRLLAERLVGRGDDVTVATRSGTPVAGANAFALDASDASAFSDRARGAQTIFLVTGPPYWRWRKDWPPIFDAAIEAATVSGAGLVVMGNLYAYGTPTGPMTEDSEFTTTESKGLVRAAGWRRLLDAHERGQIRAVEVRASDYFGPGAPATAHLGADFFHHVLASQTARVVGPTGIAHSWSYLPDIVETLIAASDFAGDWGRAWHVPSGKSLTRQQIVDDVNALTGSQGRARPLPDVVLAALAAVSPLLREVRACSYQFRVPFVIDSTVTERLLGVTSTPWYDALSTTIESYGGVVRRDAVPK